MPGFYVVIIILTTLSINSSQQSLNIVLLERYRCDMMSMCYRVHRGCCRILSIVIIQSKLNTMNDTSQEEYFGISQVAETLGLFLYIINPAKSSFETIEECPDYVSQVGRYFLCDNN